MDFAKYVIGSEEVTAIKTSFTYELPDEQQLELEEILRKGNYRILPAIEHSLVTAETPECRIVLYKSGKCLIQGKGAEDFVMFVLEPNVLRKPGLGYEETLEPDAYTPHMGIDESGKGDFFGNLVVAGVFTDRPTVLKLQEMGVKDSKRISSDKKALAQARDIRKLLKDRYSVVSIGPSAYNRLYMKLRNVNRILAWAHARAIENLLNNVPSCPRAISDQFGNKDLVLRALMGKGKKIELVQRHHAESDMAVAAASVLARSVFLLGLDQMSSEYGVTFSKGASAAVVDAGRSLVEKHGPEALLKVAKCHFKTADDILKSLDLDRSVLGAEGSATSKSGPSGYGRTRKQAR